MGVRFCLEIDDPEDFGDGMLYLKPKEALEFVKGIVREPGQRNGVGLRYEDGVVGYAWKTVKGQYKLRLWKESDKDGRS